MENKLFVGLGNPGGKHQKNRHNVGHMVVDALLRKGVPRGVVAKKTTVFMNNSGEEVKKLTSAYSLLPSALYIVHDDLDIRLGEYKIQKGKGPKLHKGIESIDEALGTSDYWRVRVGVDNREVPPHFALRASRGKQVSKARRISGEQYVLQDFTPDEREIVEKVIKEVVAELILRSGGTVKRASQV